MSKKETVVPSCFTLGLQQPPEGVSAPCISKHQHSLLAAVSKTMPEWLTVQLTRLCSVVLQLSVQTQVAATYVAFLDRYHAFQMKHLSLYIGKYRRATTTVCKLSPS